MPSISIKDIAQKAGVSVGTVDRVIHDRGKVSKKTEEIVLKVLKEHNYTPNLMARNLAKNRKHKIAALIPHSNNDPFWEQPLSGIRRAASLIASFGFSIDFYHFEDGLEKDLLQNGMKVFSDQYDALIIAPIIKDESVLILEECELREIPYVQINTLIERESPQFLNYIGQDSYKSGVLAAKLLDFGLEDGDEVLVLHLEREVYNGEHLVRKEMGFRDYFNAKTNKNIFVKQLSFSEVYNDEKRINFIKYAINLYPKLKGIFVTTSKLHMVINDFDKYANQSIKFVGYDLVKPNLELLSEERIFFLINQNPAQQGYLSVMSLFNYFMKKETQELIHYLPLDIVMKENMDFHTKQHLQIEHVL